jgi:hypothetical protein
MGWGSGLFSVGSWFRLVSVLNAVGRCRAENGYHGIQMVSNRVHRYDHYERP